MSYGDPINVINNAGITLTNSYGLKTSDLDKAGISSAKDMQKKEEQRIKEFVK